ncbi:MAG: hypothetical protein JWN86_3022 [Planctomycetota bacterium]|nr:hypothetical protein [Planctomycetota bacterium]
MGSYRPQVSLRGSLVIVAILAMNLAALIPAITDRPRFAGSVGMAGSLTTYMSDGSVYARRDGRGPNGLWPQVLKSPASPKYLRRLLMPVYVTSGLTATFLLAWASFPVAKFHAQRLRTNFRPLRNGTWQPFRSLPTSQTQE